MKLLVNGEYVNIFKCSLKTQPIPPGNVPVFEVTVTYYETPCCLHEVTYALFDNLDDAWNCAEPIMEALELDISGGDD